MNHETQQDINNMTEDTPEEMKSGPVTADRVLTSPRVKVKFNFHILYWLQQRLFAFVATFLL